ncbi:MAG: c-type cytochrome [bacterium]|nr:c-type cytochrome [bacterium]
MRLFRLSLLFLLIVSALALASDDEAWKAPKRHARKKNPIEATAESISNGRSAFMKECMSCHGEKGRGDGPAAKDLEKKPGDLTDKSLLDQTDGGLFWKITTGRTPMPSFRSILTDEQRWHVVNFVRALAPRENTIEIITPEFDTPEHMRAHVSGILEAYFNVSNALSREATDNAQCAARSLATAANDASDETTDDLTEPVLASWAEVSAELVKGATRLSTSESLADMRRCFSDLTSTLNTFVRKFGHAESDPIALIHCGKAFDGDGAEWLGHDDGASSPYLGPIDNDCNKMVAWLLPAQSKSD